MLLGRCLSEKGQDRILDMMEHLKNLSIIIRNNKTMKISKKIIGAYMRLHRLLNGKYRVKSIDSYLTEVFFFYLH